MANEIKMPQLSDTMDRGKIVAWLKKEGDQITRGDALAEVETDKANLQIEAFYSGTLLKISVPVNSAAKVGEVIAYIGQAGESLAANGAASGATAASPVAPAKAPAVVAHVSAAPVKATEPVRNAAPSIQAPSAELEVASGRIKASPLAKKIAAQRQVDLHTIQGSGPQGRIVAKDVESAAVGNSAAVAQPQSAPPSNPGIETKPSSSAASNAPLGAGKLTPFSKMRETIARRMQQAVAEAPHFYVQSSINMRQAVQLREALKERAEFKGLSLNHLVIKAAAYALAKEPRVNRAVRDGQTYEPEQINVGIITALDDGLLIPVVREANKLSLQDLAFEARAAVERARAGRPSASDLLGGTFSISNMGMYDVESFTAIINPGQGAVLAVSSVKEVPVVERGALVVGSVMKVTLSVDHRIIDGAMAASFLKFFKEALELPALLMN